MFKNPVHFFHLPLLFQAQKNPLQYDIKPVRSLLLFF